MITVPLLALIGQFLLIALTLIVFFVKFMGRISKIEARLDASEKANEVLTNALNGHVVYVKEEFQKIGGTDKEILNKLEGIKDSAHKIELDVVEIKSELKFKNGNKN